MNDLEGSSELIEVGNLIRQQRELRQLTQFELAALAGIGEKTISRLELGKNMKILTFFTLAKALGVTPNDISPAHITKSEDTLLAQKFATLTEMQKKMVYQILSSIIDSIISCS